MHSYVRTSAIAIAAAFCAAGTAQKAPPKQEAVGGLSFSPLIYRVAANPGASGVLEFNISNPKGRPSQANLNIVSASVDDWTYKARYGAANPRDCSTWFPVREAHSVVGAKGLDQQFRFKVPTSARGSYWALLVFTPRPVGSRGGLNLLYEVPIMIQVGRATTPDIKLASPQISGTPGAPQIGIGFVNDGESFGIVGAQCTLKSVLTGRKVSETRIWDKNVYPHTKRRLSLSVPTLAPGRYELTVSPEIGSKKLPDLVSFLDVRGNAITYSAKNQLLSITGVAIEPSGMEIAVPPGGTKTGVVRIRNTKATTINLQITATGVDQNSSGALGVGKSAPPSALSVAASPSELSLPAGAVKAVRLTVKTDRAASGDLWFGLKIGEQGVAGIPQQMLGVVSIKSTLKPALKIVGNGFEYTPDGQPTKLNYLVKNTGNSGLQPKSVAGIVSGNRLVNSLVVPATADGGIIPGATLQASVMLPLNMPPGKYEVQIKSRYSKTGVATLSVPFTVTRKP